MRIERRVLFDSSVGETGRAVPRQQERMARAKGTVEGHEDQAVRDQRTDRGNQQDWPRPRGGLKQGRVA
jgi:hypothetical protein